MAISLSTDYLVIGSGATGMAFVDELINTSQDVRVILVDKRAKPGGHWTDAYDFVKLEQPAAFYGVNSRMLGTSEAAFTSKAQILAYYELVMEQLEATGRLSFYPQCNYLGDGEFESLVSPDIKYKVEVSKKIVDATYLHTAVPSTTPPNFKIADGVNLVPINGLVKIQKPWKRFVVIGAGKTGVDAIVFLLDKKVDPDHIVWIMPNSSWFLNRDKIYPLNKLYGHFMDFFDSTLEAKDLNEAFQKLEDCGQLVRIDKNVCPTRYKAATISSNEMEKLRKIKNIIRQGRIERIEQDSIKFKNGEKVPTDANTLHIDCSAAGSAYPPAKKIWDGDTVCLQMVVFPQAAASGAIIAAMELKYPSDEEKKNQTCQVVESPVLPWNVFKLMKISNLNGDALGQALGMGYMRRSHLNIIYHMGWFQFLKITVYMMMYGEKINKKFEEFSEQEHIYGRGLKSTKSL